MDLNNDREFDPIPQNIPEDFVPEAEPETDTAWHGTGAGVQEFIHDAPVEPGELPEEPAPEPVPEAEPVFESAPAFERAYTSQPEEYTVPRRRERKPGFGKKLLAGVLAAALVIGSCAATAGIVNRRWEKRMQAHQAHMDEQLAGLRQQMLELEEAQTGVSVSGSPMSSNGGMSPSQVYAMNVNSVVAISNQTTTNVWGQVSETAASGTGFIISADGYILSNYHVVEGANKLTVITYMGDEYEAKLVGFDKMNDVSILKVEASGLEPVTIGSSDDLIVGDQVWPSATPWAS